jgi:hypothetical protein
VHAAFAYQKLHIICLSPGFSSIQPNFTRFSLIKAMEVFGVISSMVSVLDSSFRAAHVIQELISDWRDVPVELIALANEINDSRAVITQARSLSQRIDAAKVAQSDHHSCGIPLERLADEASPIWNTLNELLNYIKDEDDPLGKITKTAKCRWLRSRSKAEVLRTALKEKRLNIIQFMVSSTA